MNVGDRSVDDWWMNLAGKRLVFKTGDPAKFDGELSFWTRDMDRY
jgi:hypothetical protein